MKICMFLLWKLTLIENIYFGAPKDAPFFVFFMKIPSLPYTKTKKMRPSTARFFTIEIIVKRQKINPTEMVQIFTKDYSVLSKK